MTPQRSGGALVLVLVLAASAAFAQELTPRAYAPKPIGGNFFVLSYVRTTGDVTFDPALPVEDTDASISGGVFAYARTFGLFGRSAAAQVAVPYLRGTVDGILQGQPLVFSGSGGGDLAPKRKPRSRTTRR